MCIRLVNSFGYLETSGRGCFAHGELKLEVKKEQVPYFIVQSYVSLKLC